MSDVLHRIKHAAGAYAGRGSNHEGESFTGRAALLPIVADKGIALVFTAIRDDGELLHEEHGIVAPDSDGVIALWALDSNMPGLRRQNLSRVDMDEARARLVFSAGDPTSDDGFRIDTVLEIEQGFLTLKWGWALPGDALRERSSVRMAETDGAATGSVH